MRIATIAVVVALTVAACGSSGSNSTSSAGAASPTPRVPTNTPQVAQARIEAAQCFRSHGIDIPDFTPGGGRIRAVVRIIAGYPAVKVQSVTQACASSIRQAFPNLVGTNLSGAQLAQRRREGLAFAQCMRAHGISFPDPTTIGTNISAYLSAISSLDTSSPAYKTAANACRTEALKAGG